MHVTVTRLSAAVRSRSRSGAWLQAVEYSVPQRDGQEHLEPPPRGPWGRADLWTPGEGDTQSPAGVCGGWGGGQWGESTLLT